MQTCREKFRTTKMRESVLDSKYKRKTFCIIGVSDLDSKKNKWQRIINYIKKP